MKDIGNGAEFSGSSSFNRSRSNSVMLVAESVAIVVMVEEVVVVIVVVLEESRSRDILGRCIMN